MLTNGALHCLCLTSFLFFFCLSHGLCTQFVYNRWLDVLISFIVKYLQNKGCPRKKLCGIVFVTAETIFVQFLRSRCHSKALYFSYFIMWNFSFYASYFFCYNQLFELSRKSISRIFQFFWFFTSHFHSFIKYGKIYMIGSRN